MKKVGIDIDSTVADFIAGAVDVLVKYYGITPKVSYEEMPYYSVLDYFSPEDLPNFRETLNDMYIKRNLLPFLPKLEPDVEKITQHLTEEDKVNVYFITARDRKQPVVEDTRRWLTSNGFAFTDVLHQERKHVLCDAMGVSIMYEDNEKIIKNLVDTGIDVVVRDMPWNRDIGEYENKIHRAHNWQEALDFMRIILNRS